MRLNTSLALALGCAVLLGGCGAGGGLMNRKGHIGLLGHGTRVEFRNIRIQDLKTNLVID